MKADSNNEPTPPRITFSDRARLRLEELAVEAWPREACGWLLGPWPHPAAVAGAPSPDLEVLEVVGALRAEADRRSYRLDPLEYIVVQREGRDRGLEILGIFHSHPQGPAFPSARDRANTAQLFPESSGWAEVIISVIEGEMREIRIWSLGGGVYRELSAAPPGVQGPKKRSADQSETNSQL